MVHQDIYRGGKKLVSVTELQSIINKPFLENWKKSLCQKGAICGFEAAKKVAEEAADLGTSIHEDVENWFKGNEPVTPWGKLLCEQYKNLNAKPELIRPEQSMIDEESGLAGSPDAIIRVECEEYKGLCIADNKIKNSLDDLTGMQGAGYRYLLRRKHGVDVPMMLILWAQKKLVTPKVKLVWIPLDPWIEPLKHLVGLWNVINPKRRVTIHGF